ncbi:hypothetical protein PHYBOEH_010723 [Phytophthora boehmeriae]|uniref:Bzip transcription factor n=1 Tax=Phytophthora boehmeriae TaxID=109152 RepID=A0A8T1X0G9_9STRA|nr:hypothetical protein PHYBOEH_010723 [Phytophthora boehmeriae]
MASSCLQPPNSHELTDSVIRDVRERSTPLLRSFLGSTDGGHSERGSNLSKNVGTSASVGYLESRGAVVVSRKEKSQLVKSFVERVRPTYRSFASDAVKVHKKRRYATEPGAEPETPEGFAPRTTKTRRERCRINQARYREKQRKYAQDLDEFIEQLREDIYNLELKRQSIIRCTPTNKTVWNIAAEYFRLFRHGYKAPVMETLPPKETNDAPITSRSHPQLDFLQSTMATDVVDGALNGPEELLKHWRLLSVYHKDVNMQLKRLEGGPDDSLVAIATISLTITENTVRGIYPHLCTKEGGWSLLAKMLLGRSVDLQGSVRFVWDSDSGRVAYLDTKFDLLLPMLRLLGSFENVARVFDGALITPECKLVVRID